MKSKLEAAHPLTPEGHLDEGVMAPIVGYLLAQASVTTDQVFASVASVEFTLRKVEFTILALIRANPDLNASALAKALAVTSPNITMWLDKLEARGLIARERSLRDRRSQHVRVTAEGAALTDRLARRLLEAEQAALSTLSVGERAMLAELLHKVGKCRRKLSQRAVVESGPVPLDTVKGR